MTIAQIIAAKKKAQPATTPGKSPHRSLILTAKRAAEEPPENAMTEGYPPKWLEQEPRSLSTHHGEAIPMTPTAAEKEVATWHEALNAFESSLCIMRDPEEESVVWLAISPERPGLPPLLIHRLPWCLWNYPMKPTDTEPF